MSQNINLPNDFLSTLEKTGQYSSSLGTVFAADGTIDLSKVPEYVPQPSIKKTVVSNSNISVYPELSLANKVKSLVLAMASAALQPAASRAQRRARLATCAGCRHFKPTGDFRIGFCGACGCGQSNPLATLAVKSKILRSSCPRLFWDKVISLPILPPAPPPAPPEA